MSISGADEVVRAAAEFEAVIGAETLARRLDTGGDLAEPDSREAVDIDGRAAVIAVRRAVRQAP